MDEKQQLKAEALAKLKRILPPQSWNLRGIDPRLQDYYYDLLDGERHNLYEILGGLKHLRILRTYPFNHKKVRHAIQLYEGQWRDGLYVEGSGGLMFSGLRGFTHYQMQPWQVFATAGLLGPHRDVDGDLRRLCTELVLFLTRKSGKTQFAAFVMFYGFFFMDANFEGYCCANSSDQAKLLYRTAQALIRQMDPQERRIRFTASQTNWRVAQPRQASMTALSAGGKTKDGLFAQLCCADEFGSADFTNGKSDMLDLVSVVQSSMGPRREPLTVITTTAGYAVNGPFINQKMAMEARLLEEITLPDDSREALPDDFRHALLLQPDPWEQADDDLLLTDERVWLKSNPMIGISVQPDFYRREAYSALQNPDRRKEFITKLVNVYAQNKQSEWVKPARIREMQIDRRIDDCCVEDGWDVYVGMDFSQGNDLHAVTYLAVRWNEEQQHLEYFADLDAWVNEETLSNSSIRDLYERWIADGWLHVSEGAVFRSNLMIARFRELDTDAHLNFVAFGYDSRLSHDPINELTVWLQTIGVAEPDKLVVTVGQTPAAFNQSVDRLTALLKDRDTCLSLSASPLWPWEFGCSVLDVDTRMDNKKPVKRNPGSDACKVDNVQCLCEAFILEEQFNR